MTLSLRQRRRLATARDIQHATLELGLAHGLDSVTTEAVAEAAGISTRTFFNYYANKESAAIGTPPGFGEDAKNALQEGTQSVSVDLRTFLVQHIESLSENQKTLRLVRQIVRSNTKALGVLDRILVAECEELANCLTVRIQDQNVAKALAEIAITCKNRAIHVWEQGEDISLLAAFDIAWAAQVEAAQIFTSSGG